MMQVTSVVEQSPRLKGLEEAVAAGDRQALDTFWQDVTIQGSPLIEPHEGDSGYSLVTFLWRADGELDNVVVFGNWSTFDLDDLQMFRLRETDCWYRTYRMPNALRASYWFAPNDSLVPWRAVTSSEEFNRRLENFRPDPLNPRTLTFPGPGRVASVVELPGTPPQPWIIPQPDVPNGELQSHQLHSAILDNERRVWTYLPPGYTHDAEPYHLLIVLDGAQYTSVIPTPVILDNLLATGHIPPMVAIFVDNAEGTEEERSGPRSRELPCYPPFADFLAEELVPWARANYHVSTDPSHTIVAGSSFGGLAAAYAAFRHPELFGNVLSQSGSFQWKPGHDPFEAESGGEQEDEWLIREYAICPRRDVRFYLDVGVFDSRTLPGERPGILLANRHMRNVLQAKGYPLHYAELCGGHDYACWRGTVADGLLALQELDGVRDGAR